jgi:hypothetical protein
MRSHCGETTRDGPTGAATGTGHNGYLRLKYIHDVLFEAAAGGWPPIIVTRPPSIHIPAFLVAICAELPAQSWLFIIDTKRCPTATDDTAAMANSLRRVYQRRVDRRMAPAKKRVIIGACHSLDHPYKRCVISGIHPRTKLARENNVDVPGAQFPVGKPIAIAQTTSNMRS